MSFSDSSESGPPPLPRDSDEPSPLDALRSAGSRSGADTPAGKRNVPRRQVASVRNTSSIVSLALGCLCVLMPAVAYLLPQWVLLAALVVFVSAIVGGIAGMMGVQSAARTRRGKRMAQVGMVLCLIPMVLTILLWARSNGLL